MMTTMDWSNAADALGFPDYAYAVLLGIDGVEVSDRVPVDFRKGFSVRANARAYVLVARVGDSELFRDWYTIAAGDTIFIPPPSFMTA